MEDNKRIERVQRRATKMVRGLQHLDYRSRLIAFKLPSLEYRRRIASVVNWSKMGVAQISVLSLNNEQSNVMIGDNTSCAYFKVLAGLEIARSQEEDMEHDMDDNSSIQDK